MSTVPPEYVGVHRTLPDSDAGRIGEKRNRSARRERSPALSNGVGLSEPAMHVSEMPRTAEPVMGVNELAERLRGMFLEVPGTRLSISQAARLAGVEASVCRRVLDTLAAARVLKSAADGTFMLR
jgi:hypothetical protein